MYIEDQKQLFYDALKGFKFLELEVGRPIKTLNENIIFCGVPKNMGSSKVEVKK